MSAHDRPVGAARFGSVQAGAPASGIRRWCRAGQFTDDLARAGPAAPGLPALALWRMHGISARSTSVAPLRCPACSGCSAGADLHAAGASSRWKARSRSRARAAVAHRRRRRAARARHRALRRRGGGRGGRRRARAAMNAVEAMFVDYDDLPAVTDPLDAMRPARRCCTTPRRTTSPPRCATATRPPPRGLRPCRARGDAGPRQPAPGAGVDGAARACCRPAGRRLCVTLRCQARCPPRLRDSCGRCARPSPSDTVRVLKGDVGGGFGMKTALYPGRGRGLRRAHARCGR